MVYLSHRQQDIYRALKEDVNPNVTPEWVVANYPSTDIQPRKKKKSSSKTKRKKR